MENGKKIVLEPVIRDFVDALNAKGGKPLYTLSPQDARQVLLDAQKEALDPTELYTDILTRDMTVPAGPSKQTSVRLYRPENTAGLKIPVVLYIHGGGWVLGNEITHDRMVRRIAHKTKCAVIFVNYTPAPEAQYPVQIEQCYGVFEYLLAHEDEFAVNASRIAVAGDSVGGNMSAALTLLANREHPGKICFQALLYPVTNADFDTPSYLDFAEGPWLTREAMKWFWDNYAPDKARRKEITASPLLAEIEELRGLPPALVVTDANDVLRDEGEAYAQKLMLAGVPVTAVRYLGAMHDFMMLNAVSKSHAANAAMKQTCRALKRALHRS